MDQITTLNFFRYPDFGSKFWAFSQMGLAHKNFKRIPGMKFYKLLGTGSEGFSIRPDWSVYALLQVWEDISDAEKYFTQNRQMQSFLKKSEENLRLYMRPIRSHGFWDGNNPFPPSAVLNPENPTVAVITRATIRKKYLRKFWNYVPESQRPLRDTKGLFFSKGIGESPFIHMATFSLWEDIECMKNYAYGSLAHQEAIRFTRELGWYKEELFARFQPYRIAGSWSEIPDFESFKKHISRIETTG